MDILNNILKKCSLKELEKMYDDAKKDHTFGGGFRQSAISRELNRRRYAKNKKKINLLFPKNMLYFNRG